MAQEACPRLTSTTGVDRRPHSVANLRCPHSLAISPNLDALLEFEERHRAPPSPKTSPVKVDNDLLSLSPPTTPTSLPPPPRGQRSSKAWLTRKAESNTGALVQLTRTHEVPGRPTSTSESNPYINPAPRLEDLLLTRFTNDGSVTERDKEIRIAASACEESVSASGPFSLSSRSEATGGSPVSRRSPHFDGPSHLTTEYGLSIGKSTSLPWVLNTKSTSHVDQTTHKIQKPSTEQGPPMIQSPAQAQKTETNPYASRDTECLDDSRSNSHGKQKLEIKTDSLASSPSVDSMLTSFGLPEPDRHSFIDLFSPILPDSECNDSFSSSFDDYITSRPLLKTAPKHTLDNPGTNIYRQSQGSPQSTSTQLLGPNGRAGLVKKTRKLTRMFGQTPEAGILLHTFSEPRHTAAHISSRRHSLPLAVKSGDPEVPSSRSPISFIDLSDEDDNISMITSASQVGRRRHSIVSPSLIESISQEEKAEEERRRKREKLVKLHRFLGSQVPPSLALGLDDLHISLPPERSFTPLGTSDSQRPTWARRRRSSSATDLPSTWSDEHDRMRAELCSREKAINVKRAQKMEKVFGVAPPQTLFHTRHIPPPPLPAKMERNQNRTPYTKNRSRKSARSRSTDSRELLLTKDGLGWEHDTVASSPVSTKRSRVYTNYAHSLNSLHDILDKDDRASLTELHHYLTSDPALFQIPPTKERRSSVTSSVKSDRRHSLPASMTSISSEISFTKPDLTDFQIRRRRAAKLTNFFGVDYRVLIQDVLESIESGLDHERKRGTLAAEEAEDLLQKLRQLTLKRPNIY